MKGKYFNANGTIDLALVGILGKTFSDDEKGGEIVIHDYNNSCNLGHLNPPFKNVRCSTCSPGYASTSDGSGLCVKCQDSAGSTILLVLVVVRLLAFSVHVFFFFLVFLHISLHHRLSRNMQLLSIFIFIILVALKMRESSNSKKAAHSTMKRSLLTHLHMISIVMSLNVAWPKAVRDVLAFVSSLTSVAGNQGAVQCVWFYDSQRSLRTTAEVHGVGTVADIFYVALIFSSLMPLGTMILTYVYWFVLAPTHTCYSCGRKLPITPFCPTRNPFSTFSVAEEPTEELSSSSSNSDSDSEAEESSDVRVPLHSTRDGWITTNLLLIYVLYPSIVKLAFQMLQLEEICEQIMWAMDDKEIFGVGRHGTMVWLVALPTLFSYGIILPCLGVCYLRSKKDRQTNAKLVFRCGLLYSGYAPKYYWWEVSAEMVLCFVFMFICVYGSRERGGLTMLSFVLLLLPLPVFIFSFIHPLLFLFFYKLVIFVRKLAIILIVTFGSSYDQQLHVAMGLFVVLLYLHEHARPYMFAGAGDNEELSLEKTKENNRLHLVESSSLLILILMVWSAVFFDVSECGEKDVGCSVLGVLVIVSNVVYAFACGIVVLSAFADRNHKNIAKVASFFRKSSSSFMLRRRPPSGGHIVEVELSEMKFQTNPNWITRVDQNTGENYYENSTTGETKWDLEENNREGEEEEDEVNVVNDDDDDVMWTTHVDPASGSNFYVNSITGETKW